MINVKNMPRATKAELFTYAVATFLAAVSFYLLGWRGPIFVVGALLCGSYGMHEFLRQSDQLKDPQ